MFKNLNLDMLGMGTSLICAVHCLAIPFLISFAASAGLEFLQHSFFEVTIFGLAAIFIIGSLLPGLIRHHKNSIPLIFGLIGLSFVFANHEWLQHKAYWLSFTGAVMITYAHYKNLQLNKKFAAISNG